MSANPINNEAVFEDAAFQHWRRLGEELRADVEAYNRSGESASFSQPAGNEYRVTNPRSGLEVRIVADAASHIARYDFVATDNRAGAPEGGILSMRAGTNGVEFYSSDQQVTAEAARKLLLDPVLHPPSV